MRYRQICSVLALLLSLVLVFAGCSAPDDGSSVNTPSTVVLDDIPEQSGDEPYTVLDDNIPTFTEAELVTESYETYSELDSLGRCGVAEACVGVDIMPTEDRESISEVRPTGWINVKYDFVDGKYLYNRCHLIGFQLTGENANEKNLITGTRYFNVDGMLPFENMVADYVKETENHVMYRVTPVFEGDNLVATGAQMEAFSVEDGGEGICFNVFVYNIQPGVVIDYSTGESRADDGYTQAESSTADSSTADTESGGTVTYILNVSSKKYHVPECSGVEQMSEHNKQTFTGTKDELEDQGYTPCGSCKP